MRLLLFANKFANKNEAKRALLKLQKSRNIAFTSQKIARNNHAASFKQLIFEVKTKHIKQATIKKNEGLQMKFVEPNVGHN